MMFCFIKFEDHLTDILTKVVSSIMFHYSLSTSWAYEISLHQLKEGR